MKNSNLKFKKNDITKKHNKLKCSWVYYKKKTQDLKPIGQKLLKSHNSMGSERERNSKVCDRSLHLYQMYQSLKLIEGISQPSREELESRAVHLPKKSEYSKTVVFDLDETLVHCSTSSGQHLVDLPFSLGNLSRICINLRPFLKELLKSVSKHYEVIVFTASQRCYADTVLDFIDPGHKFIHHRLYREHCIPKKGLFIKDLRILANRKLEDTVIVDNFVSSFGYQLANGIPVTSWYDNPNDGELLKIANYLEVLANQEDVRVLNKQTFKLHHFCQEYLEYFSKNKENKPS